MSTFLLVSLLISSFIPALTDPFNYDYFDLDGGQMPPINTDCHYGLTDGLIMTNSLEKSTNSSFYFKPILSNENCFLRLHSTSTAQGKYISDENVTINYGFNHLKGRNTFLILYTLIFLLFTNKLKLNESNKGTISVLPYIFSIPIFIYESFYFTNIIIYCLCLYIIQKRADRIRLEDYSIVLILSILFPLAIYQSHVSIWLMFLLSFINIESFKNKYISTISIFIVSSSLVLNKLVSIEVLNNHYLNSIYNFIYKQNVDLSTLPTYLDQSEMNIIGNKINQSNYYQIIDFSNRISTSAFPAKNILFLNKSPDIFSSLIVSIVIISLICFAYRIQTHIYNKQSTDEFIYKISWGGISIIAYTYFITMNDFINHNIKIITGSLREAEVIPELFVTDWRGVFYSAEGGGEVLFIFSFCGIYSLIKSDSSRSKYLYTVLTAASIYGLFLTSSSSSIILLIFSTLILFYNRYLKLSIDRKLIAIFFLIILVSIFFLPSGEQFDKRISESPSNSSIFLESNTIIKVPISNLSNLLNRQVPWSGFFESYSPSVTEALLGNSSGSLSESWVYNNTQHNPHSMFLFILYSYGLLGVIAFILLMLYLIDMSFNNKLIYFIPLMSSLLIINNLKSDNMILFSNAFLFSILLGISLSKKSEKELPIHS